MIPRFKIKRFIYILLISLIISLTGIIVYKYTSYQRFGYKLFLGGILIFLAYIIGNTIYRISKSSIDKQIR